MENRYRHKDFHHERDWDLNLRMGGIAMLRPPTNSSANKYEMQNKEGTIFYIDVSRFEGYIDDFQQEVFIRTFREGETPKLPKQLAEMLKTWEFEKVTDKD